MGNNKIFYRREEVMKEYERSLSYEETAFKFGVSVSTVRDYVIRAYKISQASIADNRRKNGFDFSICANFGCGKPLSIQEGLFGRYCMWHQCEQKTIDLVDKVLKQR